MQNVIETQEEQICVSPVQPLQWRADAQVEKYFVQFTAEAVTTNMNSVFAVVAIGKAQTVNRGKISEVKKSRNCSYIVNMKQYPVNIVL